MNAIATLQQNYVDVEFAKLNDLATRLRTAKAKITVKKIGTLHRIILLQQPTLASVEQILSYAENQSQTFTDSQAAKATEIAVELTDKNGFSVAASEVTVKQENTTELATLDQLNALKSEKLKQLATTHKIAGCSKMDAEKLAEKLQGLVTQSELI